MNGKDLKNISLISSIVEKHFGLDKKSLEYFKSEITSTTIDSYFETIFKEHKVEDLRVKYKIPREICSTLDNGWKVFIHCFSKFIEKYNFTYDNFVDNKVLIDKNNIKIRKALIAFYTDINNFSLFRRDMGSQVTMENIEMVKNWEIKKSVHPKLIENITAYIDQVLDSISQKCLPKSDIYLVLSCNFADWFLCSTAESWKSCLNMESEFHGAYWTGVPGLIGDKNRCLLYITDSNKKTYQGISVDKIIARSWGLLSTNEILHINKPYPLADMFDARIVSVITGLKTKDLGSLSSASDFTSKNKIHLTYFNDERKPSCFIYQDNSGFSEDLYIKRASSGFYAFIKGKLTRGEPIIRYENGLTHLVEKGEAVDKYIIRKLICSNCGHSAEDVMIYTIDGEEIILCQSCLKENYSKCHDCRAYHKKDYLIDVECEDGKTNKVCKSCLIKNYSKCEICNKYFSKEGLYTVYDNYGNKSRICKSCVNNIPDLVRCNDCGSYMPQNMILQADLHGTEFMCENCLRRHSDKKQFFFSFVEEVKTKEKKQKNIHYDIIT